MVSYRIPADVERCLASLSNSDWDDFEVFVCENGGYEAFKRLKTLLTSESGPLELSCRDADPLDRTGGRLAAVAACRLRGRSIPVRIGAAAENLGYAGGVNAWLERLMRFQGWEAVLVLNPDTVLSRNCLSELMGKAAEGFGMVGGTLVFDDAPDRIINYGLHWSRVTGRTIAIGRNALAVTAPSPELLATIDAISGACVLVTRSFINDVGLMDEDYFLYMEDLDWGLRRGGHHIGFAPKATIRHIGGTSIGSATEPAARSPLSVYLASRNRILFMRRWAGWWQPIHVAVGLLYAIRYLVLRSPRTANVAFKGLLDGARGSSGRPDMTTYRPRLPG